MKLRMRNLKSSQVKVEEMAGGLTRSSTTWRGELLLLMRVPRLYCTCLIAPKWLDRAVDKGFDWSVYL